MTNYRRQKIPGATYFFTQVTHLRHPWLCHDRARQTLRQAIQQVRQDYPFEIDAIVLLPDHLHCIWTLPEGDSDYSTRWRLIKTFVTRRCGDLALEGEMNESRLKRREGGLWQRRFWEHRIRDDRDFANHCDYIHFNPVKHGLCQAPRDWEFSSFGRFVRSGWYGVDWRSSGIDGVGDALWL